MTNNFIICFGCGGKNLLTDTYCNLCGDSLSNDKPNQTIESITENSSKLSITLCPNCNTAIVADAKFCHQCGNSFTNSCTEKSPKKEKGHSTNLTQSQLKIVLITAIAFVLFGAILTNLAMNEFDSNTQVKEDEHGEGEHSHSDDNQVIVADSKTAARISELSTVIKSKKDKKDAWTEITELGEIYIRLNRFSDAASTFELAYNADTTNMRLVLALANLYDDAGNKSKAVNFYRKYLVFEPNNVDVRVDLSTALLMTETPMEAIQELRNALERDPNHQVANLNMGIMYTRIGRNEDAKKWLQNAQKIDPTSVVGQKAKELLTKIN